MHTVFHLEGDLHIFSAVCSTCLLAEMLVVGSSRQGINRCSRYAQRILKIPQILRKLCWLFPACVLFSRGFLGQRIPSLPW